MTSYKELEKLAPIGILKQALALYEIQTREFINIVKVSKETKQQIKTFDLFRIDKDYKQLFVIPLDFMGGI